MGCNWMKILIACEYSGVVRDAFQEINKEDTVISCDILPSSSLRGTHLQCDIRTILNDGWDLMIAHPPCTHLAVSGARWFKDKREEQEEALDFVRLLLDAPIKHIALENPVSIISSRAADLCSHCLLINSTINALDGVFLVKFSQPSGGTPSKIIRERSFK